MEFFDTRERFVGLSNRNVSLRSVDATTIISPMTLILAVLAAISTGAPEPREDARRLLEKVVETQERNQALQRQYAYVETVRTEHLRKNASISKSKEETFGVTPAPGGEYRRLIGKNGRPLTSKEQQKEEEKFQKYLEKQLKLSPDELKTKEDNLKKRVGRFESRIQEALEVFEFTPLPDEEFDEYNMDISLAIEANLS